MQDDLGDCGCLKFTHAEGETGQVSGGKSTGDY